MVFPFISHQNTISFGKPAKHSQQQLKDLPNGTTRFVPLSPSRISAVSNNLGKLKVIFCVHGVVSPLLANIYLHYALDLWSERWRRRQAKGDVIIVRYADDAVFGFQYRSDAEKFLKDLNERLGEFKLELHQDKTRLIEFGRFAAERRRGRGEGKPETFDFLGFTHICGRDRNGKFIVLRHTIRKRLRGKLAEIKQGLRRRLHWPIPEVGRWLRAVLQGHYNYYGVPRNGRAMSALRFYVGRLWFRSLGRRSQKTRINWQRVSRIINRWLPYPRIRHPFPEQRLRVITQGRSPVR